MCSVFFDAESLSGVRTAGTFAAFGAHGLLFIDIGLRAQLIGDLTSDADWIGGEA